MSPTIVQRLAHDILSHKTMHLIEDDEDDRYRKVAPNAYIK